MKIYRKALIKSVKYLGFRGLVTLMNSIFSIYVLKMCLNVIGTTELAAYFILISIGQFISTIDFGVGYKASLKLNIIDSEVKAKKIVLHSMINVMRVHFVLIPISYIFLTFFKKYLFSAEKDKLNILISLVLVSASAISVLNILNQHLVVQGKLNLLINLDMARSIITFMGSFFILKYSPSLLGLILVWCIANVVPGLILFLLRYVKLFQNSFQSIDYVAKEVVRERFSFEYQISTFGGFLNNYSDQLIVSIILGPSAVVFYQVLTKSWIFLKSILGIIWLQLWPLLVDAQRRMINRSEIRTLIYLSLSTGIIYTLLNTIFGNLFITRILGFNGSISFAMLLLSGLVGVVFAIEIIASAFMMEQIDQKLKVFVVFSSGVINVLASIFLVSSVGLAGTFISSLIVIPIIYIAPILSRKKNFIREIFSSSND